MGALCGRTARTGPRTPLAPSEGAPAAIAVEEEAHKAEDKSEAAVAEEEAEEEGAKERNGWGTTPLGRAY